GLPRPDPGGQVRRRALDRGSRRDAEAQEGPPRRAGPRPAPPLPHDRQRGEVTQSQFSPYNGRNVGVPRPGVSRPAPPGLRSPGRAGADGRAALEATGGRGGRRRRRNPDPAASPRLLRERPEGLAAAGRLSPQLEPPRGGPLSGGGG